VPAFSSIISAVYRAAHSELSATWLQILDVAGCN
jgi:hypothetical protein